MYSSKPRNPVPVYLNVYDLGNSNSWLHGMGLGAYHSGIEVYGREYSFGHQNGGGGTGVFEIAPRSADGCVFREQVPLGSVLMSMSDVNSIISKLKPNFKAAEYHILTRNCNSFSDALSQALLGHGIPAWVNRLAAVGQCCSCFLPPEMQPKNQGAAGRGGGSGKEATDKLLSGSGRGGSGDSGFVAFQGAGHSMTGADTKTPAPKASSSSGASNGGGGAAAAGGGAGADEKREKMRRAALDRLTKQSKGGDAGGAAAAPANAI